MFGHPNALVAREELGGDLPDDLRSWEIFFLKDPSRGIHIIHLCFESIP